MSSDVVIPPECLVFEHTLSKHHLEAAIVQKVADVIKDRLPKFESLRGSLELLLLACNIVESAVSASRLDKSIKPDKMAMVCQIIRILFPVLSDVEVNQMKQNIEVFHSRELIRKAAKPLVHRVAKFFLKKKK